MVKKQVFLRIGGKYQIRFPNRDSGKPNVNNRRIHIRGLVDDQVVLRWWDRAKHDWVYEIEDLYYFTCLEDGGYIKDVGNG